MENIKILNYQGNKTSLMPFIEKELSFIMNEEDTIVDIFSGSGSVGNSLKGKYNIVSNDAEKYSSVITSALLNPPQKKVLIEKKEEFFKLFNIFFKAKNIKYKTMVMDENLLLKEEKNLELKNFYESLPSVWNNHTGINPKNLRKQKEYNLFQLYYTGSYFGLCQSIEIDTIIKTIHHLPSEVHDVFYSCLFYSMKETVFSKDGHMAQPLNILKNPKRHIKQRNKKVIDLFTLKLEEFIIKSPTIKQKKQHIVLNDNFLDILNNKLLKYKPKVIYADPPYTDMQYSRYYHLLNVAVKYEYPELTETKNGYTKGLYTEGRNQSGLSQKGKAKEQLEQLFLFAKNNNIKVVLSYAFPKDQLNQSIDRYTVTIEELINSAQKIFGEELVYWEKENYQHANHRNSTRKEVYEYLIVCGHKKEVDSHYRNIHSLKKILKNTIPTSRNDMYNSHLYWSQKSFNVINELIEHLSDKGDVVFDPFLGSGVTILESIKKGTDRIGVGCDINEMPLFISKTLLNNMQDKNNKDILENFSREIDKLKYFYETKCPKCGSEGDITKVIFDKPYRTTNKDIKISSIHYNCIQCKRSIKSADELDIQKMFCDQYQINYIKNESLITNSKIAVGEDDKISYIFTPRNFKILDEIVNIINSYEDSDALKYILMSILHLCKITDTHSNSQWPLWIPKINCVEKNIIDLLQKKIKNIDKTIKYINNNYYSNSIVNDFNQLKENKALLLKKGSQNITNNELADDSVSLIITDPPYMEQVLYSEYMQLYKPFLNFEYNLEDEIIVSSSPKRKKDKIEYFNLLNDVFELSSKKLKIGGYMCLFFHDSNLDVWSQLISILEKNGFKFISQEHIKKSKTVKNILSPKKSLNGDAILFFENIKEPLPSYETKTDMIIIEKNILDQTKMLLSKYGPMSTPELYDNGLMEVLIQNGWLNKFSQKYKTLVEFFDGKFIWQKENGTWKLD